MQTDLITKVYFNEHLTHSCVGMPQCLQALSSSLTRVWSTFWTCFKNQWIYQGPWPFYLILQNHFLISRIHFLILRIVVYFVIFENAISNITNSFTTSYNSFTSWNSFLNIKHYLLILINGNSAKRILFNIIKWFSNIKSHFQILEKHIIFNIWKTFIINSFINRWFSNIKNVHHFPLIVLQILQIEFLILINMSIFF